MSTTTATGRDGLGRAARLAALLPWRTGRVPPEEETEVLVGVLRRWSALVSAGRTEEQAWRETACTLPACTTAPGAAATGCCAHHRARRRAEALAWDVPAGDAMARDATLHREAARRGGTLPWRTPARDPGWALVDAALAAGARAGAAPAASIAGVLARLRQHGSTATEGATDDG